MNVWNRNVEVLVHVAEPDDSNVCDDERSQMAL